MAYSLQMQRDEHPENSHLDEIEVRLATWKNPVHKPSREFFGNRCFRIEIEDSWDTYRNLKHDSFRNNPGKELARIIAR